MSDLRIDPARLEAFALAYVPAALAACKQIGPWTAPTERDPEQYAVAVALDMIAAIKRAGIEGVAHYYLNDEAGALKQTCATLGIEYSNRSMDNYLEGK
jgi:hypothetical protein